MELKGRIFKTGVEELERLVDRDSLTYLGLISISRQYLIDSLSGEQRDIDSMGRYGRVYAVHLAAPDEVMGEEHFSNGNYIEAFNGNSVLQAAHRFIDTKEKNGTSQFFILNASHDVINRLDGEFYKFSKQ